MFMAGVDGANDDDMVSGESLCKVGGLYIKLELLPRPIAGSKGVVGTEFVLSDTASSSFSVCILELFGAKSCSCVLLELGNRTTSSFAGAVAGRDDFRNERLECGCTGLELVDIAAVNENEDVEAVGDEESS